MNEDRELEHLFERLFTVDEANALLPTLIPLLKELKQQKEDLDQQSADLEALTPAMRSNGHALDAVKHEQRIAALMSELTRGVQRVLALGVEVKDLNQGLVDFPHRRADRLVYLCWKLGEERLAFWHDIDAGFAGRQSLE
jgi:hypothetical protein